MARIMKSYRVYYIRDGKKLTKVVYAISIADASNMVKNATILSVRQIDLAPPEEDDED